MHLILNSQSFSAIIENIYFKNYSEEKTIISSSQVFMLNAALLKKKKNESISQLEIKQNILVIVNFKDNQCMYFFSEYRAETESF